MATCKACLHVEACELISQRQEEFMNDFFTEQGKEISVKFGLPDAERCPRFKDRARFVELPCKLGDEIFYTTMGKIHQAVVDRIELYDEGIAIITTDGYCPDSSICYHTREEAEKALKERENSV